MVPLLERMISSASLAASRAFSVSLFNALITSPSSVDECTDSSSSGSFTILKTLATVPVAPLALGSASSSPKIPVMLSVAVAPVAYSSYLSSTPVMSNFEK